MFGNGMSSKEYIKIIKKLNNLSSKIIKNKLMIKQKYFSI